MAGLPLVLGVEVHAGNAHSSKHGQPGLLKIPDALPWAKKPKLVRGDNGYGTDGLMSALEEREQPYLFKPKLSKTVKRHISCLCDESDWTDAGQGWEGKAGQWALQGWNGKRCVVVLRRPLTSEKVAQDGSGQLMLSSSTPSEEGQRRSAATSTPVSSPTPATRFSASVSSTRIGPMPRAPSMNSRTSGAGAATPRTTRIDVSWLLVPWH